MKMSRTASFRTLTRTTAGSRSWTQHLPGPCPGEGDASGLLTSGVHFLFDPQHEQNFQSSLSVLQDTRHQPGSA